MNKLYYIRAVDKLGRVVLPIEFREQLNFSERQTVSLHRKNNEIVLTKHQPQCLICGGCDSLTAWGSHHICKKCLADLKKKK